MLYIRITILVLFLYIFATQAEAQQPYVPGFQLVVNPVIVQVDSYNDFYWYRYSYYPVYRPLIIPAYYQSYRYVPKPYYPPSQYLQPPRPMPQKHK